MYPLSDKEPDFITLQQMADKLQCSVRSINRLRKRGQFPARFFVKFGRSTRVLWSALVDSISDQPIKMKSE